MTLTLTKHLVSTSLNSKLYIYATQHDFLRRAGNGTLSLDRLALWLSQDRIYAAHAYPRFIGALIARIPFKGTDKLTSSAEKENQDVLQALTSCLSNIIREVNFFKETADNYEMDMDGWEERKGTRDYTAEMARVSQSMSFEEGLVFLWAMEKVYFDAWSYVRKTLASSTAQSTVTPAIEKFSINWSSLEFDAFVESLAVLVDNIKPGTEAWDKSEEVWKRVLELEVGFWPEEGEELALRK